MKPELMTKLNVAVERLILKKAELLKAHPEIKLGTTGMPAPEGYVEDDPKRCPVNTEWPTWIQPEKQAVVDIMDEILAEQPRPDTSKFPKINSDKLWVWGGPTPYWGGSMADDTLVRGAKYFNAENGVYVYGPTNEKMMGVHSGFKRLLCQINSNCRSPGAQENSSDQEDAERLSRLSLQFPNIMGAMCDDLASKYQKAVLPDVMKECYSALKKHNERLQMYGVVYTWELEVKDYNPVLPYIDAVALWFWRLEELIKYDHYMELVRRLFPGKKIVQGVFIHEYGRSDSANPPHLLKYQLDKTRQYMAEGLIEGVIILGDREIKKWPESAEAVKNYLLNQ